MEHQRRITESRCPTNYLTTRWFCQVLSVVAFIGFGSAAESVAFTVSPTALTFMSEQGATTSPPNQILSVDIDSTSETTLTNSDDASWLMVSPGKTSVTSTAQLTVAVNTSGLAAGTYNAIISVKVKRGAPTKIPVMLTVSPSSQPPPPATKASLSWDPVTDPTLGGYKVYIGTASGTYSRSISVGNTTSYTVDSLTTGTTYFFSVTAYNSAGESAPSNEVSKSIY